MAKKWSDVAASSAFQALSLEEQEEARNQYFASVIAPQVPEEDLSVARDQFFATTSVPKAAPVAATGQRDRVDNPLNPNPKRGIIDSVLDFFKPAPKSVMDGYVAPPSTVPLIQQRGAPLSDKKFNELREVYDNATPQDRKKLIDSSKPVYKSAFKAIDDQYRRVDEKNNRGTVGNVLGTRPIDSRIENRLTLDEIEAINDPMAAQRRDFAKENPFVSAIASGSASAVSGAINIPSVAADFLNQSVVNPILRSLDLPELGRAPTMFGTEYLTKSARDYMPEIGRKSMMGAWKRDEFAKWLGVKLAANSPQIAQSLAAAFAPPLRAVLLPGMGGTAAGQSFVEGDDSRVSVAKGLIEVGTEMLPVKAVDKIGDILKNMGPTKSSTVLAVASQRLLKAGGTITANGLTNAIEETAAQLGGNALDKYFQGKDIELTNGLAEAAVVGAATGKTMSVPQVVSIAQGTYEPDTQIARALDEGVASTDFVASADQVARDRLNPNTYDSSLIDPSQTRIPQVTNFTPADSPSAQAGLAPIIVPEPTIVTPTEIPQVNPVTEQQFGLDQLSAAGGLNVGTDSNAGTGVGLGGIAGSDQLGGSVGVSGLGIDSTNRIGGDAGIPAANVGADVVARGTAGEQSPAIARLPQLDQRATDQDLLARVQSAIAPQENNNANTQPTQQWFGRKGDGYVTEDDAQQALPGRQRMFPNLNWSVEQMPSGKYRLAGYSQETTNVATPAQTQQAEAQGQEAPAALARQPESSIDLALQQAPLPDTVFAELSSNPGSADTRAAVQSHLDDLVARGVIAEAPKLGAPDADAEATVNVLGNLIGDATGLGQRVVPYKEVGGTNGFAVQGTAFVNTWFDPDSVSAGRTTFHEIRHVAEQIAAADTKAGRTNTPAQIFTAELDSIFDDIKDEGKRAYVENFLHKDELDAISDPAEREAKLQEFLTSPLLRSEMVADFLGNRATDRAFLVDLARQDPGGFEGFVKKWLAVIDNMIAKLRGGKTQGQKESAKVDKYIRDLNVAKMIARDALIEFRKGNFEQQEASQQSVQQESQPVAESKREAGIDPQPASKADMRKAAAYEKENGILPYTSEGQLEVPVNQELPRFSIKQQGKYGNHPLFDIPVNANGTVTMYYPTTNAEARRVAKDKTLRAAPGSNRIYLTNESSAPKVMGNRGNITQEMEGANVLVQVDPSLLQLDMEHSDGRKDFFIPIAEGKAFFDKMRMTRLFTQNAPRSKALTKDTKLTDLERRITDGVNKYLSLTKGEQRIALKEAKAKLKREHNVTTLLGVNGKLEKTNTGGYGLNNYDGKDVKSMGLGLASAQKINENNLSTCPKSAICESLCLGETSGQNLLYGGDGQYKSGPRLAQYLKTEAMVVNPEAFAVVLHSEIAKLARDAKKEDYQATVRLNVTSDFRPQTFAGIINAFPDVMFYDYTKLPSKSIAENHHLTYSSTGASQVVNGKTIVNPESNWNKMVDVMRRGDNVAMAFSDKNTMPKYVVDEKSGERFQVWNGDNYDARFLDPKPGQEGNEFGKGMIIGLTNKDRTGKPEEAAEKNRGFFVDYNPERDGDTVVIKNQDILAGGIKFVPINEIKTAKAAEKEDAPAFSKRQVDKPLTERQFYSQYVQHIDLRARASGKADQTREAILRDGFKKGVNVNAFPPYRGGEPTDIMQRRYMPRAGDIVYLAPKSAWKDTPNGATIQNGWKPEPWEAIKVTEDGPSMYQEYLKAWNEYNEDTPQFSKREDRSGISQLAYQGYQVVDTPRVQASRKINGIIKKLDDGKITPAEFELQVRLLADRMANVTATKEANRILTTRERGADIVREKLIAARRRNEIDPETTEFALWALQQNPAMAEGLGISVREQPANQRGAAGDYNPAAEIMRVFKGKAKAATAVHEILHHTERMMPAAVQVGIRQEWAKAYSKALAKADEKQRAALEQMLPAMAGDQAAQKLVRDAFSDGTLDADQHYQLTNPSEYWAVNATDILKRRYDAGSWIGQAKQWLSEMLQKAKGLLGLRSDAPVLRGLQAVLDGNAERQPGAMMLANLDAFNDITAPDTPEFKRWFGDSKVVDENGEPLVVYHGTNQDIDVLKSSKQLEREGLREVGYTNGIYFASNPEYAGRYGFNREGTNIMPVYLSMQNPKILEYNAFQRIVAKLTGYRDSKSNQLAKSIAVSDRDLEEYKKQGYDGLINKEIDEFVVFDSSQIKSATGNVGTFDPDNADIRYSKRQQPIQGQQFYLKGETRTAEQRRIFQDYFLRMKEVQDAIAAQGGVVDEAQDVYLAETLSYGRLQEQLTDFKEKTVKPMLAKLRAAKLETSDLALYAYAMHAKERNAAMSSRNARLKSDEGSGMTDKEADDIIDAYRQDGKLKDLQDIHKDLMAITSTTRLVLLDEGLISQEEFDAYENQYSYYVPLRGFITDESDLVSGEQVRSPRVGGGKGFNIRGKETVRALGRTSRAGHIIENIISDYERAIARSERNNVAKKFLDLVTTNRDPDLWQIDAERTTASLNKQTGMVQYNKLIDKGEDTISVKIDGKEVYIKINDPLLVRAMRAAGKDETGEVTKFLVNTIGWYGNLMRNTLTRFNPAFGVTNAIKDFGFSSVSMLADLGPKGMALFWKNYANPKQSGPIYEEFRAAGATTGGWHMRNTKDMQKELRTMMTWEGGSGVKFGTYRAAKGLLNTLEWVGQYSETQARFAAYKAARDMGLSPARAASIAKEVSTNFNRKGEWGSAMNTAYVFFNAGVQGSAKTLKNLRSPYVMGAMAGLTGLSTALAFMGASVGGDDDDEQAYWDKIPDEIKQRNIIIMLPPGDPLVGTGYARVGSRGRYIKIPIQYGLNVFSTLGYQIADVIRHVENKNRGKSVGKAAINMTSVTFGAFNPIGGAFDPTKPVDVALAAAPSIVDVAIQFAAGVDAFGRPTSPAKSPFDQKPDSENYSPAMAGSWEQRLTTWLNANTGGDQAVAGAIDLAPGTVRNMVRNVTGGAGDFLSSVFVNLPSKMLDPAADIKSSDIPILKALYGEADESTDLSEYYQRRADVMKAADEAGRRAKLGIKFDYDEENVGLQSLGKAAKVYTDLISELRKREIEIGTDQSLSKSEITQMRKDIQRERVSVARDFNNLFMQMKRDVEDKKFLSKEILEYEPSEWVADKAADYKVERREKLRDNKDRAAGLMD